MIACFDQSIGFPWMSEYLCTRCPLNTCWNKNGKKRKSSQATSGERRLLLCCFYQSSECWQNVSQSKISVHLLHSILIFLCLMQSGSTFSGVSCLKDQYLNGRERISNLRSFAFRCLSIDISFWKRFCSPDCDAADACNKRRSGDEGENWTLTVMKHQTKGKGNREEE